MALREKSSPMKTSLQEGLCRQRNKRLVPSRGIILRVSSCSWKAEQKVAGAFPKARGAAAWSQGLHSAVSTDS